MKSFILGLIFSSFLLASVPTAKLTLTKITNLELLEVYDTHLVHAGRVWEGKTAVGEVKVPAIDIYGLNGKLLRSVEINYSPTHIFPAGDNAIVVTGRRSNPQFATFYTKIAVRKGGYEVTNYEFPPEWTVDHFVGDGKREIFALWADRGLLAKVNNEWKQINTEEVIGPHNMVLLGDNVYVLNHHNIVGSGFETISKVDLKTGSVKIVSGENYLLGARNLYHHQKSGLIVFPEFLVKQVTLFDPKQDKVVGVLPVEDARGLSSLGHCLAVASEEKRLVTFFDLRSKEPKVVSTWDLSSFGTTFNRARNIGIDEGSGRLYARSTYLCTGCQETMSSVVMAEEESQATLKACR